MYKRSQKSRRGPKAPRKGKLSPPQLNGVQLNHSVTMRFVTNAAVAQTAITFANLLDSVLVATSATQGYQVFQSVRVRAVEVWALPSIGQATTVQVEFGNTNAGLVGDQVIHTDTSMGIRPAHVLARPSSKSLASDFQVSGATSAFILTCPSGSVIDVQLTFHGQYSSSTSVANALVGATTGALYLRGLDGLAVATTVFPPAISANFQI